MCACACLNPVMVYCRSAIVMQYLAPPHFVMRGQLVKGATFAMFSQQMSEYLARTLFESGFLNLGEDKMQLLHSEWDNSAMCELTEKVPPQACGCQPW